MAKRNGKEFVNSTHHNEGFESSQDGGIDAAPRAGFGIVGIGASAGGLEACSQLLHALPGKLGMAIVIVQHLTPRHESVLPELLRATTELPVAQVTDGMKLELDRVYVIPPNTQMVLRDGVLSLAPRPVDHSHFKPIDTFFSSLAEFAASRAIGVVLSGLDGDGASGLAEIKAAGGITMVQEPRTARYPEMPRSSIARGVVDLVLSPPEIAGELGRIAQHSGGAGGDGLGENGPTPAQLDKIFVLLQKSSGVNFSHYKQPTIRRRLHRRMLVNRIETVESYIKFMEENPAELPSLYQDLLIHVTRFFRDPETFKTLASKVFPKISERASNSNPIRIWIPGCATGEEAYSVAMALLDYLGNETTSRPVQIFATDVSEKAVATARAGVYPETIAGDVPPELMRRFFNRVDGSYRISRAVRDICVFARQDLTRDPPFSKIDLILCRNVLIYIDQVLQKKLIGIFHYALRGTGYLMLGSAESVGPYVDLFLAVDKKHKLYLKKGSMDRAEMNFHHSEKMAVRSGVERKSGMESRPMNNLQSEADRVLLARFSPAGVLVDGEMQILQFRGQTGKYLEPAPGSATLNLLKMAREGLLHGLRSAITEARKSDAPARREKLRVKQNGHSGLVNVEVIPLAPTGDGRNFLVLFQDQAEETAEAPATLVPPAKKGKAGAKSKSKPASDTQVGRLQQELAASREYLQSIIQDLEGANEELQSANEEILSSNEELQSTNEELDTAKEELQSTNEELNTLNEELQGRNDEMSRVNSDLVNLLGSVQIAVVIVSGDMRIRRFTPMAEKLMNLIPSDVGRPIRDIKPNFDAPDLDKLIAESVDQVSVIEKEVRGFGGNWFSLRIRPYKNLEKRIDGAVVALFDNEAAKLRAETEEAREFADAVVQTIREPLAILDGDLRVVRVNRAFYTRFKMATAEVEGKLLLELGGGQWNIPRLQSLLMEILQHHTQIDDFLVEHQFPGVGKKRMLLNARMIEQKQQGNDRILLAIEDLSQRDS